jgi:hypothetical protein
MRGIRTVRHRLPRDRDLATLFELFDERIARVPELWESSNLREHPVLGSIAVIIARQVRPSFEPKACRLYEVGDTGFWHGALVSSDTLACLFYDELMGLGLVALSNPLEGTPTEFIRFTRVTLGPPDAAAEAPWRMPC